MKTFEVTDRRMVSEYFLAKLDIQPTSDFRGVLHVPSEYTGHAASMDQVGIAVGYCGFIGKTCSMHTVITRPDLMTQKMMREFFEYPFNVCGLECVLALVESTNGPCLKFIKKVGFKEVHRIPNGGLDDDLIVLQMLRADCRWLDKATH